MVILDDDGTLMRRDRDGELVPDHDLHQARDHNRLKADPSDDLIEPGEGSYYPARDSHVICDICGRLGALCRRVDAQVGLADRHEFRATR